ncbi:MAG: hypothetical protein IJZ22_03170 [Bacteroidaceae bacterium]|nr:hypothetical protein [Bacteroidaceae bacterium]
MKKILKKIVTLPLFALLLCSCGEDRSGEFNSLTQENQWIYSQMKEVYLWAEAIGEVKQNIYFSTPKEFFKKLLLQQDNVSFFTDTLAATSYGITYSLMRDPLGITPSKTYALVEYVEPASVAAAAGLVRGMWISEIDGNRITTSSGNRLSTGTGVELTVHTIDYDDIAEQYFWDNLDKVTLPAATEISPSPTPVTTIIDDITTRSGYILCNTFDGQEAADALYNALATISGEAIDNIIIDLRYNNSTSLADAAVAASPFIPAGKQGTFCSLTKNIDSDSRENILTPSGSLNVSEKPLYIITTARTQGVASVFIKAIQAARNDVRIVGKASNSMALYTECYESPYLFKINPVTAYILDATGEPLTASVPDFNIDEYSNYYTIYPLGSKQENILNNISYIIANGTLPPTE